MKISAVRSLVVNAEMRNWVFVRVETDQPGLYGWGEATLEWKTAAVVGAISDLAPFILGRDPRDIGQLVRIMIKHGFWPPGVIGLSAISGIEIALWDILGKSLGQPVWRLLGGAAREKVRVYTHLGLGEMKAVYETTSAGALAERARAVLERGYRAVKVVIIPYTHYTARPAEVSHVGAMMRALREAMGENVEIMVDFHGRPASVAVALAYIEAMAPYHPMFVEEPVQPGDPEAMQAVTSRSPCPIAAGERLVDPREFAALFNRRAIDIAQPDLCHCGGFSGARRIAAMAEAAGVGLAPHNPLGPIATIAAWHFDIATAGFVIQEEMSGAVPWFGEVVSGLPQLIEGSWHKPEGAGLGLEVNEAVAARHPIAPEVLHATHAVLEDGTIVDW